MTVRSRVPFEANECARGGLNIISVGVIVWGSFRIKDFGSSLPCNRWCSWTVRDPTGIQVNNFFIEL